MESGYVVLFCLVSAIVMYMVTSYFTPVNVKKENKKQMQKMKNEAQTQLQKEVSTKSKKEKKAPVQKTKPVQKKKKAVVLHMNNANDYSDDADLKQSTAAKTENDTFTAKEAVLAEDYQDDTEWITSGTKAAPSMNSANLSNKQDALAQLEELKKMLDVDDVEDISMKSNPGRVLFEELKAEALKKWTC